MEELNLWLVGGGLVIGLVFGIAVQRTQFCMVAAVSNIVLMRDFRHAQAYLAALAVAILGTLFLETGGLVTIAETGYRIARYDWPVIVGGGLLFGLGSVLAGGCAGRTTVRAAEGNLGALIVLLAFSLTAAATYFGALEPYRVWLIQNTAVTLDAGDSGLSAVLGWTPWLGSVVVALVCIIGILVLGARRDYRLLAAGIVVGSLIVGGWFVTGYLSEDDFSQHRAESVTIAGPLARSAVFLTTGSLPGSRFSIALMIGIVVGAMFSAVISRSFHWVMPEVHHLKHLLVGGGLMGVGAICAGGCNIGIGLTGMSTSSVRALTALLAIVAGMLVAIMLLNRIETTPEPGYHGHTHAIGT